MEAKDHSLHMARQRVGLYLSSKFHHAILEPIYALLASRFQCQLTDHVTSLIRFNPQVIVLADAMYDRFTTALPHVQFVWTRHGFASKNFMQRGVLGCDFACVSSEWVRGELTRQGLLPRQEFWVTGFVPMDPVFQGRAAEISTLRLVRNPKGPVILYAPTWNDMLSSAPMLGTQWMRDLCRAVPEATIIVKPHPHISKEHPEWMTMWRAAAAHTPGIVLIKDSHASVFEYMSMAQLLITDASSVMFYYLALDRPMVLVNNPGRMEDPEFYDPEGPEWTWRDMGVEVDQAEDLVDAVRHCLRQPSEKGEQRAKYRERVFGSLTDGRAAERIVGQISSLLEREPLAAAGSGR